MTASSPEKPINPIKAPGGEKSVQKVEASSRAAEADLSWTLRASWLTPERSLWSVPDNAPSPNETGTWQDGQKKQPAPGEKLLIDGAIVEAKAIDPKTGRLAYADAKGGIAFSDVPAEGTATVSPKFLEEHGDKASPESIRQWLEQSNAVKNELKTALEWFKWEKWVHIDGVKKTLTDTPAVMTEGEAKEVLEGTAWSLGKQVVNPDKNFKGADSMNTAEQARAKEYQGKIISAKTPDERVKVMTEIRDAEKVADRKDAIEVSIKAAVGSDKDRGASLAKWYEQYEQATWPAKENIKNAIGTKVGDEVKFSNGTTLKVTENKNGVIMATGVDPVTWGDVTHSIKYENFKWKETTDGRKCADGFNTIFGSLEKSSPSTAKTEQQGAKSGTETAPREDISNKNDKTRNTTSATSSQKISGANALPYAPVSPQAKPQPQKQNGWFSGSRYPVRWPDQQTSTESDMPKVSPDTPAVSAPIETNANPVKAPEGSQQPDEDIMAKRKEVDTKIGFDTLKGVQLWNQTLLNQTILSQNNADKYQVSVYNNSGTRSINIGRKLSTNNDGTILGNDIQIYLKSNWSIDSMKETRAWSELGNDKRQYYIAQLKGIGINIEG